jgi:hypothetical protein
MFPAKELFAPLDVGALLGLMFPAELTTEAELVA